MPAIEASSPALKAAELKLAPIPVATALGTVGTVTFVVVLGVTVGTVVVVTVVVPVAGVVTLGVALIPKGRDELETVLDPAELEDPKLTFPML
jgi:hypothetical protein